MTQLDPQLDPRLRAAITRARARASHEPPAGAEDRMLADFHARLGGPPPDGSPPPEGGNTGAGGGELAGSSGGAQVIYAIKIVAAVAGLTAAGLGGLWLVGQAVSGPSPPEDPAVVARPGVSETSEAPLAVEPPEPAPAHAEVDAPARPTTNEAPASERPDAPRPAPRPASEDAGPSVDLAAELKLIRAARAAEPAAALELLDEHAEQFPAGELSSEREGLRTIALCELGRLDEARDAADRFVALRPGPLLRERVEAGCGEAIALPTTDR